MNNQTNQIPYEYQPISMWGYFGYQVLFSIPVVGFVFLVVYALGGTKNVNKRNFARSYFCYLLILIVIMAVLVLILRLFLERRGKKELDIHK